MAPSPFRRRKGAKTVRNLAIAEAALALAKDRATGASGRASRRPRGKLLLLGGAVAAAGAAALLKRDKVAGLLPSHTGGPAPVAPPAPPQPSNYDAPGPVANTATPIPAPDPHGEPPATIDAQAEEAAAAAEAGAIGGSPSDYAGPELGEPADEAFRPLAEAGEGEAEGQEQAEAELADNATYRDGGMSDAERQIEDTIEQADQPLVGETPEPIVSGDPGPGTAETDSQQPGVQETFLPPAPPVADATPAPVWDAAPAQDGAPAPASDAEPAPAGDAASATDETEDDLPGGGISGRPFAGLDMPASDTPTSESETPTSESGGPTSESQTPRSESDAPTSEPDTATSESGAPTSEADAPASEPEAPRPAPDASEPDDDWRTWSGRSVNP